MAYQSKYTGLQIDDILDSVEYKQDQIEDLESIRAGAAKGATALQSYTEKYTGTVTGIKINGTVKSGSGVIDLGTITTVTESTVSGWGFTKNAGTYSKPSGGIPKSDLASAVQTSLGKADTALQSYTEQYKGTITGVSANGTSVATSGVANIPAASTSAYGVTKLSSATNSTSTTLAATASAVKSAYDLANGKQDKLVSGTNIKNVYVSDNANNYGSILGSGELYLASVWPGTSKVVATGIWNNYNVINISTAGLEFIPEEEGPDSPRWSIHRNGDGTKFLSDDGTYKTISSSGGSSNANIQAVDTGDVIDDVTIDYATKTYVAGLVGDINSVLESIING